ncbi:hypothetical protein WN48_08986 [Eufriesea mexicana]|uniref:Uncharacterized protein n=1 Tax=Eufriesea mexicana TaxID=516756 RepID=A0A310ST06_9HYME|nr:hypothetical protein WN48_08986 [Eufriesea mexicana]
MNRRAQWARQWEIDRGIIFDYVKESLHNDKRFNEHNWTVTDNKCTAPKGAVRSERNSSRAPKGAVRSERVKPVGGHTELESTHEDGDVAAKRNAAAATASRGGGSGALAAGRASALHAAPSNSHETYLYSVNVADYVARTAPCSAAHASNSPNEPRRELHDHEPRRSVERDERQRATASSRQTPSPKSSPSSTCCWSLPKDQRERGEERQVEKIAGRVTVSMDGRGDDEILMGQDQRQRSLASGATTAAHP